MDRHETGDAPSMYDDKYYRFQQRVGAYLFQLDKIIKAGSVSHQVRFKIQDVIELRAQKWIPQRIEGPRTIDAIHKEEEQKRQVRATLLGETFPADNM